MFSQKKPFTAVTVTIERLTNEGVAVDDMSGLPDLVDVVQLQETGPTEAARAIRKKLKYGHVHRQLRALTLLDGLIQNAGTHFQRHFADEPLLERLRFCGTAELSDPAVRKKCAELFRSWATDYKDVRGMEQVCSLYRELPRRTHVVTQEKSKVLKETENPFGADDEEESEAPAGPSKTSPSPQPQARASSHRKSSSMTGSQISALVQPANKDKGKKDKKAKKHKRFNLETEKEEMKANIAEASIAATNLANTLQSINRERERISDNEDAVKRFEACKLLRRKILRYIHHVESEEWLGGLLHANDELVTALMTYEQLDRSIDADSDSDDELAEQAHLYRMATEKAKGKEPGSPTSPPPPASSMAGLSLEANPPPKPPRPAAPPRPSALSKPVIQARPRQPEPSDDESSAEEDDDENNPFADRNSMQV